MAFLPISETETSVVYSVRESKKIDFNNLIKKHNGGQTEEPSCFN